MPRADERLSVECPFPEWSSRVWTGVVQCIDDSIEIDQGNPESVRLHRPARPWRKVAEAGDTHAIDAHVFTRRKEAVANCLIRQENCGIS